MKKKTKYLQVVPFQTQHPALDISISTENPPLTPAEQNRLIIEYMDLASAVAQKYRAGKIPFEDLVAFGREGLVEAARSWRGIAGFAPYAQVCIENSLNRNVSAWTRQWVPDEAEGWVSPRDADKIERIFEWDIWGGDRGQAAAIAEGWLTLESSPEEMAIAFEEIADKRHKFAAAFISLTSIERALVRLVYLSDPAMSVLTASQEIGISYRRSVRSLARALEKMRALIERMDMNQTSRGASHVRADLASPTRRKSTVRLMVVRD